MKKIPTILAFGLFIPLFALGVARAPVNLSPLQPLPADTAPNASTNMNTPGNAFNDSQAQIEQQQEQTNQSSDTTTEPDANQSVPNVDSVPAGGDLTFYWFLVFVGVAGLVAIGFWAYFRFSRKQ